MEALNSDLGVDFDEFRQSHESDEHWELRKEFLVRNYGSYPLVRLLCLSQVFANVEFLGCVYPKETMDIVAQMSQGITQNYRANKKSKLQRTFVKASSAAETKCRGSKNNTQGTGTSKSKQTDNGEPEVKRPRLQNPLDDPVKLTEDQLVLVELNYVPDEGPLQIINRSCTMCHMKYELKLEHETLDATRCTMKLGNFYELSTVGTTKEEAKINLANQALAQLRQKCYTLEIKQRFSQNISVVERNEVEDIAVQTGNKNKAAASGIASRMMKLMGWAGGALGKNEDGIEIPISVSEPITRTRLGLGHHDRTTMSSKIADFITEKIKELDEIVFSSEFTKTEREIIHNVSRKLNLKSRSHGKEGTNRQIIVFKKVGIHNLVQRILESGESDKYRVIRPGERLNS